MSSEQEGAICFDCQMRDSGQAVADDEMVRPGEFCKHWQPEYWETLGYQRSWGDAAVMNWPHMEILRREKATDEGVEVSFVILAPYAMRRPVVIKSLAPRDWSRAWGSY